MKLKRELRIIEQSLGAIVAERSTEEHPWSPSLAFVRKMSALLRCSDGGHLGEGEFDTRFAQALEEVSQ